MEHSQPEVSSFLKDYSTYGIGGKAKELVIATTKISLIKALLKAVSEKKRYIVIGKGSNSLFDEKGFNGVVIVNRVQNIEWEENRVKVSSGYSFSLLGVQSARKGYSGLEFASGIPGSIGGAVYMNAGAGGKETKDSLYEVEFLHESGEVIVFKRDEITFAYRESMFQKMKGAILSATFILVPDLKAKENQEKLLHYRMATQPYKDKSCGSVFRNPTSDRAGKVIESLGLKGFCKGGAKVSEKHANFIVNVNHATSTDVLEMIEHIQCKAKNEMGVELETEVRYIPFDE